MGNNFSKQKGYILFNFKFNIERDLRKERFLLSFDLTVFIPVEKTTFHVISNPKG